MYKIISGIHDSSCICNLNIRIDLQNAVHGLPYDCNLPLNSTPKTHILAKSLELFRARRTEQFDIIYRFRNIY